MGAGRVALYYYGWQKVVGSVHERVVAPGDYLDILRPMHYVLWVKSACERARA